MSGTLRLVTPPTREIVTLDEAKNHLMPRISHTDEDVWITEQIRRARVRVENACGIACFTQTWELKLDRFLPRIHLPRFPLASVTSITYLDTAGATQTWACSNYTVDTTSNPGRIYPAYACYYPVPYSVPLPITITYVAGYTSVDDDALIDTKSTILKLVQWQYSNRGGTSDITRTGSIPQFEADILASNDTRCEFEFMAELGNEC